MSIWGAVAKAAVDIGGKLFDAKENRSNLASQLNLSRDSMQHGIRWRVNDAKRAGIHPLYALGAQGPSFSPISVGSSTLGQGVADSLNELGQDISRATNTQLTGEQRQQQVLGKLQVERAELENDLLRSQIAKINSAQLNPPAPTPNGVFEGGIADSAVEIVPRQQTATPPFNPAQEAGVSPSHSFLRNPDMSVSTVRSMDAKERLEEDLFGSVQYALRNNILPMLTGRSDNVPDASLLPKGAIGWKFNRWMNSWEPVYRSDTSHVPKPRRKPRGIRIPRDYRRGYNPFKGY